MASRDRIITRTILFLLLLTLLAFTRAAHAAIVITPESLVTPGQGIIASSSPTAVFGINAVATAGESALITGLEVDVFDSGLIVPEDFASISIYDDSGLRNGEFDNHDGVIWQEMPPFGPTVRVDAGLAFTVVLSPVVPIPQDDTLDNAGYDWYVVIKTSTTVSLDDTFFLRIPSQTISVDTGGSFPPANVDTSYITVVEKPTIQITMTALPVEGQGILPGSGPTEIYGINANCADPAYLSSVTVEVDDIGEVPEEGLAEITPSDFLKFQIYRDAAGISEEDNGVFNPPTGERFPDILVAEAYTPFDLPPNANTPFFVRVYVSPSYLSMLPRDDVDQNRGYDFYITVSTSDTIDADFYDDEFSYIDDFKFQLVSVAIAAEAGGVFYFPEAPAPPVETSVIMATGNSIDLQPLPMDLNDARTYINPFPGICFDTPGGALRYYYFVPGENLRIRYLGERDREFTGISQDTVEAYEGPFEQPVVQTIERRHAIIGIDAHGGTNMCTEYLTGLTITMSNLGSYLETLIEFDPYFAIDKITGKADNPWYLFFSGIAVYQDTNNNGEYDEPILNPLTYDFDPATGDQPLEFYVFQIPVGFSPFPYDENLLGTTYMLQLYFDPKVPLEMAADEQPDFFIVSRLDSGDQDDSKLAGDGTAVNFGADFKISLERAEDFDYDGVRETPDYNGDGLPQTPPVQFEAATPHDSSLCILADNSIYPDYSGYPPYEYAFKQVRRSAAVIDGQDLSMDYGYDLWENDPGFTQKIVQRIDATSPPTALLGINAAMTSVPIILEHEPTPKGITEINLNFFGDGFESSDIKNVLLVRDDKSPFDGRAGRSVGVYDIFNDLYNMPPPGQSFGSPTNPYEESPIPVQPWTWQNDEGIYSIVLYPIQAPRIYPNDDIESDASIDVFTDNYEMINSSEISSTAIPQDKVFPGADFFIVIETSDSISYDDEINVEIPRMKMALDNGLTVFEGANLFNPEDRYSEVRSIRANVPVKLHDLVSSGAELGPNSECATAVVDQDGNRYVPVIGFNMYTNRPPAAEGGVDVYFEQLIVAFLQYGTRDSFNLASDFVPFENVNGDLTRYSGIQLYRDANGNGRFDGPDFDTLVKMDATPSLGPNPSRIGLVGEEENQVLMVFSSEQNRQLVPPTDTGSNADDDFFLVVRTSPTFSPLQDNFSVAVISFGPDSPFAPAPHTINAGGNRPYDAISYRQAHPWGRRGIGFVDSNGFRTRSTETINTNVFNATQVTMLTAATDFTSSISTQVTDPTHQVMLTWTDPNKDDALTAYVDENESGYWLETNIYGDFQPLPNNPLPADTTQFFFDGPWLLAGKTIQFRIMPFRDNIPGAPLSPPFDGPGPTAVCSATFWPSARPEPVAYFSVDHFSGCAPLTVNFTDGSYGNPTSWAWYFGDGEPNVVQSEQPNPSHTYSDAGTYTARLVVTNSWGSSEYTKTITVSGDPVAIFTAPDNACVGQPVEFTDSSIGIITTYDWTFGDGGISSLANPLHTYNTAGTFTVSLTVTSSCGGTSTATKPVTVSPGLVANFTFDPDYECPGEPIQFTAPSGCGAISWAWNFGDGTTSDQQNPTHTYSSVQNYTVTLTVDDGSNSDTATGIVHVVSCTPQIAVTPTTLVNSTPRFTVAPPQTFKIRNSGQGNLDYIITESVEFIKSITPSSGTCTGEEDTITVTYQAGTWAAGTYIRNIIITAAGAVNSPLSLPVQLTIGSSTLSQINLISPANGATVSTTPTFTWTYDGGSSNAFSVDVAFSPTGPWYSSYSRLKTTIYGTSWTMPATSWNQIQAGKQIYWRVRGRDLDKSPQTTITSNQVWSFKKP